MRTPVAVFLGALLLAAVPVLAQSPRESAYKLTFKADDLTPVYEDYKGKPQLVLTVRYGVKRLTDKGPDVSNEYKIVIKEDGQFVREVRLPQPKASDDLAVVLAMDVSGSMKDGNRMLQAKGAASVFFLRLPARADCGLILFNHELLDPKVSPQKDRTLLQTLVQNAKPDGGTAYLDATQAAIEMLARSSAQSKAVVVMTDGVDLNSHATLQMVIKQAQDAKVRVFTIGIGEPGKNDPVTTVLALDKSASMLLPADNVDKKSKIEALKSAAHRFLGSMRAKARSTVLEFSDQVMAPKPFTGVRLELQASIDKLNASGETAFLDAAYTAVATLLAENPPGKRAVVLMTDGIDNSSRRRKEEVIKQAKDAGIPLYMLAFGREGELDRTTMEDIAKKTGGQFFHAKNEKDLVSIFEKLSMKIHDDGVDEVVLKKLASETGGQYYPAKDVNKLEFILKGVTKAVQEPEAEKWPSLRQVADGLPRRVELSLVHKGRVVQKEENTAGVHGVVVAEINGVVYLVLLGLLGVLLAIPPTLRRLTRSPAA